jgi:thymidylate synthase ThyX
MKSALCHDQLVEFSLASVSQLSLRFVVGVLWLFQRDTMVEQNYYPGVVNSNKHKIMSNTQKG